MARNAAPAAPDPRQWVRLAVDLPLHPKLAAIDDPAAGWTYVVALCYCGQSLTDGHFPVRAVLRLAGTDQDVANALAEQGLWHLPGHDCDRCEQPKPGHAIVHDYLDHQRSAAEARDLSTKRREAGRKGAEKRWGEKPAPTEPGMAKAIASAMANGWQSDGKAMAEERRGEEKREEKTSSSLSSRASRVASDDDPQFAAFWKAYPRRTDKGHARKAWTTAVKKADPDAIVAAAEKFAAVCERDRTEPRFIPLPTTWLNGERWTDEAPRRLAAVVNGNRHQPYRDPTDMSVYTEGL